MKRWRVRLTVSCIMILLLTLPEFVDAEESQKMTVIVRVTSFDVETDEFDRKELNREMNSYLKRELRSLGDVAVVEGVTEAKYELVLTFFKSRYAIYYDSDLYEFQETIYPAQCTGPSEFAYHARKRSVIYPGIIGVLGESRGGLKGVAEKVVADFDTTVLEEERQFRQSLRKFQTHHESGEQENRE